MTGCVACAPMTELRWQKSEQIGISLRHSCACITRLLASPRLTTVGLFALVIAVIRTALEDRTLQQELPGYVAYASCVRYRLIPGVY